MTTVYALCNIITRSEKKKLNFTQLMHKINHLENLALKENK